jgi:hypothetical protein
MNSSNTTRQVAQLHPEGFNDLGAAELVQVEGGLMTEIILWNIFVVATFVNAFEDGRAAARAAK